MKIFWLYLCTASDYYVRLVLLRLMWFINLHKECSEEFLLSFRVVKREWQA